MITRSQRIPPVDPAGASDEVKAGFEAFGPGPYPNIVQTFAHTPSAMRAYAPWCLHLVRGHDELSARHREIVILRTGALCNCVYEFTHHSRMGLDAGLTAAEIDALGNGTDPGWSEAERLLVKLAEEVVSNQFVSDETWNSLLNHLPYRSVMYAVYTASQYTQVSSLLNSFGVQLEEGS